MLTKDLATALTIVSGPLKDKVHKAATCLELVPDTFYALFWLYTHNFIYVSRNIEDVLGHPFEKFEDHGMVFFQSIIPPKLVGHIYETMNTQAMRIENHPDYIFSKEFLNIEAAVYDADRREVPVTYNAVLLDVKRFEPTSYLVLCSWTSKEGKKQKEIIEMEETVKELLLQIKEYYFASKREHFELLLARLNISTREKEVARLLMNGHSTKSIGTKLKISFNTVESHRKNLLVKMKAKNTAELIFKINHYQPLAP